jgi:hypothetical protein
MALSLVRGRKHTLPEDEVAVIAEQITAVRAGITEAIAEAERLSAEAEVELDDERAESLARQAERQRRAVRRGEHELAELERRHEDVKWRAQEIAFRLHADRIGTAARRLVALVEEAAQANANVVALRQRAETELGGAIAANLPFLNFRGLLFPDLIQLWRKNEFDQALDGLPTLRPRRPPPPRVTIADPREPARGTAVGGDAALHSALMRPEIAPMTLKGTASAPAHLVRTPPMPPPPARRVPDDWSPLSAGEVRVKAATTAPLSNDLPAPRAGQVVKAPRALAEAAIRLATWHMVEADPADALTKDAAE